MALFYMDVRNVSKGKSSAVAKAAYVSGEKLYSEREQELKQYRTRPINPDSFILSPKHAPSWTTDREQLWNNAEAIEKPVNGHVMREVVVALPIELNNEQRRKMLEEYVNENFVSSGMVADVNIHNDVLHNPHAHILLTVRPFEQNGEWQKQKSKKEYLLDSNGDFIINEKGNKKSRNVDLTGWAGKEKLIEWRKNLAEKINEHYLKHGIDEKVSHLSYKDQGLEKVAPERLKRSEFYVEKMAKQNAEKEGKAYTPVTHYGKMNQVIHAYNLEIDTLNEKIKSLEVELDVETRSFDHYSKDLIDIRKTIFDYTGLEDDQKRIDLPTENGGNTFDETIETVKSLDSWNKHLVNRERDIMTIKNVLENAHKKYESNAENNELSMYGFDKDEFVQLYSDRTGSLVNEYQSLQKEINEFSETKAYVTSVLESHVSNIKEEFNFLYPSHSIVLKSDDIQVIKTMNQLINPESLTETNKTYLENQINQLNDNDSLKDFEMKSDVLDMVEEYKKSMKEDFKLKNTVAFEQKRYSTSLEKLETNADNQSFEQLDKVFFARHNFFATKNEYEANKKNMKSINQELFNRLDDLTDRECSKTIKKLTVSQKVQLLLAYSNKTTSEEMKEKIVVLSKKSKTFDSFKSLDNAISKFEARKIIDSLDLKQPANEVIENGFTSLDISSDLEKLKVYVDKTQNGLSRLNELYISKDAMAAQMISYSQQDRELFTRKNILNKALEHYQNDNDEALFKSGFTKQGFLKEFQSRSLELKTDYEEFQNEASEFKKLKTDMFNEVAIEESKIVSNFVHKFPIAHKISDVQIKSEKIYETMQTVLEKYEDQQSFIDSKEYVAIMDYANETSKEYVDEAFVQYKVAGKVIRYSELIIQKEELNGRLFKAYKEALQQFEHDPKLSPQVFNLRTELYANRNEMNKLIKEQAVMVEQIQGVAKDVLGIKQTEDLTPKEIAIVVQAQYQDVKLEDIKDAVIQSRMDTHLNREEKYRNENDQNASMNFGAPDSGDILSAMIQQAQQQQQPSDTDKKKRPSKGKLTIEDKIARDML
ncbi:MobA/MobL family protein [Exiguobacterium antarcticum]|uniref:MobA/MobL family protein n=1 Tax=Exiguobacterium antarcticum TaxID=132920 RepID=A0ABT6R5G3_9BACL|nr:MobA/MobL family protein [Exiguobacterium antarcticum]MDI3236176.1 MobA/MobL family protein [Exiguobacterium antarcticum]